MGMGISIVGLSVCSPTRMANPYCCMKIFPNEGFFQVSHLSFFLKNFQPAVKQRHARTVVPSVFKPFESLQDHRVRLTRSYIGYNSTHSLFFISQQILCNTKILKIRHTAKGEPR